MNDLQSIAKAELHCHLDGTLSRAMLDQIRQASPAYPVQPQEFARAYPVNSFVKFIEWWQFIAPIEGKLEFFFPILYHHIESLKAQNVHYAEIMIASGELPVDTGQAIDQMIALHQQTDLQAEGRIQVEFLIGHGRNRPIEQFRPRAERSLALWRAGLIAGVAIAGIEPGYPIQPLNQFMRAFHEAGLKIEVHAGEWCGAESVWDALNYGFPDRIGHGVHLFEDPALVILFQEKQLHIEFCPTSNLHTGSIARMQDHPIRKARQLGLNFSINTDDPGPFECSLTSEFDLVAQEFDFTPADFAAVYRNTLAARFQPNLHVEI